MRLFPTLPQKTTFKKQHLKTTFKTTFYNYGTITNQSTIKKELKNIVRELHQQGIEPNFKVPTPQSKYW